MMILSFLLVVLATTLASAGDDHLIALNNANAFSAEFRVGAGKTSLEFRFADKTKPTLIASAQPYKITRSVLKDGKRTQETTLMPDGLVEFTGLSMRFNYYVRPCLARYTEAQQEPMIAGWNKLPPASECWLPMEVRTDAAGLEFWFDGHYCGRINNTNRLVEVSIKSNADGAVRGERTFTRADTGLFLPLDINRIARPGAMQSAKVTVQRKPHVPMIIADGAGNADVGEAKMMQGPKSLELDENTSRTSLDHMKESLHFSVPQAFYHRAWVLCAVEPDAKKDPVLTTRLTRFGTWGRGAVADTTLTLPRGDEKPGPGIEKVGSVVYDGVNVPLYLVRVDLKTGEILDLIADTKDTMAAMKIGPYLDFEFLGKLGRLEVQNDRRHKPLATSTSAVHVFGVTLEQSPVELRLKQSQVGNVFHNDEVPETTVALRALTPGNYELRWDITDIKGGVLAKQGKSVKLAAAGAETEIVLPLAMPDLGWYGLQITITDSNGDDLITHKASFALLGKDTRKAGYESPFGTWWFSGAHYTERSARVVGPLLLKGGFRRTTMSWTKESEADFAPWKFSLNQIQWPFRLINLQDWPAAEAKAEKDITELLKRFPHCQYINLFHESYHPGAYPPELYGGRYVPQDEKLAAQEARLFELGVKAAKFIRAKFPQLKIMVGNSGGSLGITALLLRRGFPREYIDYLGSENTGQTFSPEKLSPHTTGGIWLLAETGRLLGHHDYLLAGCFEFTSRAERDLGAQRHAEWYARDVLTGLAYRFPTISPAGIADVGNAYYMTLWGGSGLCERSPLHYPKPAYVALATQTNTFASAKLVDAMNTGSASAHALHFERGSEHLYALWTARGQCEMKVEFPANATVTQVSFYGQQQALKTTTVFADTAASYLISNIPATSIRAGRRSFTSPPAGTQVISAMDDATQWQLAPDELKPVEPTRRPGKFELRQVSDDEKGKCLELQLQHSRDVPAVVGEYTALRLKQPLPIPGTPHSVGVWVKGDSSWGRIYWELTDAKGERWCSSAAFDGGDWGNQSFIDFDGWCFVTFPLTNDSPFTHVEPGLAQGQWIHDGDGKLDYPLKLTGLFVQTHRQSVNVTKMAPVTQALRLKDVSAISR